MTTDEAILTEFEKKWEFSDEVGSFQTYRLVDKEKVIAWLRSTLSRIRSQSEKKEIDWLEYGRKEYNRGYKIGNSKGEADGARKERERLDRKVFVVFYRGNGYGPFNNIEIAEAFAKFIPNHNEKKFNTKQYGEYEANIQEWTLGKAIATLRAGMEERRRK